MLYNTCVPLKGHLHHSTKIDDVTWGVSVLVTYLPGDFRSNGNAGLNATRQLWRNYEHLLRSDACHEHHVIRMAYGYIC